MNELDDHLHHEFAALRERVAQLPLPLPAFDDRRSARRRVPLPVATVVAFAVVLAIVLATITITNSSTHAPTATTPTTAAPAPARPPVAGFLTLPFPNDKHTIDVWNWAGQHIATVHPQGIADCCTTVFLSPDGTRILVLGVSDSAMKQGQILDLRGRVLAQGDFEGVWADDSRHLCDMQPHAGTHGLYNGKTHLVLFDPGHGSRTVAAVGFAGSHGGPEILGCSVTSENAFVMNVEMAFLTGPVIQVRLTTGHTSTAAWSPANGDARPVALSGSGRYALEFGAGPAGQVVDTTTGRTVATVAGQPQSVSWDGHLVVSTLETGDLVVTDWRTHRVVWRSGHHTGAPEMFADAAVRVRPHSDDLAVDVRELAGQPDGSGALWLVTPDAPPRRIAAPVVEGIG
ncbi:MAG TPA: hypothetical protein VH914_04660 [Acidimicrobiia bacterium]|jgi:hypothetical protein|nr:hypothetical protein [Acidimicrobiia bacterium]